MGRQEAIVLLGTSHVGKSTCAGRLGAGLGWSVMSTDAMGRHPGGPWTDVPRPVIEFYLGLPDDAIEWFLRVHHQNMRPVIGAAIGAARNSGGFVLEGSALRPEYLSGWELGGARAVCLFADETVLRQRIVAASGYDGRDRDMQWAIDKFIERSLRENRALVEAARTFEIEIVDVTDLRNADRLVETLIAAASMPGAASQLS
ncbi:AAA family ATPase [Pelagibacterium sp. 26DY04]|uniref:hypothetical protein n=1 Tax=Pelagibacterium sp. 26DY04 TaxID=2967130 RepID=UPI002815FBB2|nr:hypothetical protein [Pelagibacterium sp. 26DY04]WMT86319.1 AAA family ATPase [Pelagibacterium sp. 26DY04]